MLELVKATDTELVAGRDRCGTSCITARGDTNSKDRPAQVIAMKILVATMDVVLVSQSSTYPRFGANRIMKGWCQGSSGLQNPWMCPLSIHAVSSRHPRPVIGQSYDSCHGEHRDFV